MAGLQEDMAGLRERNLESLKILHLGMYAETLVSARFLCAESICCSLPLGMNLSLYLAMLIVVHAETTVCNGLSRHRSPKT